ncbi:MAG: hypothetical protein COV60_03080 [Candidatus Magasanikbacteria bacterium CG11_big_fil_rev_8_21_14_0_20_43_7]|uniref:Uncharacterized protein n=1 Tax=Candidatus Magasanikbacteria bacterium CG11_big_fil_rev_8_21_14_0_20_43_7 TaxID=1974654 RepID=A0A2H0N1Z6_9BACT|nr:MAG: hypothetical protein COV60_03080 [Candidatus Magasanikbacteria bacterium CG11_big_fil_rev_8_21_14_0_20_43_7]
MRVYPLKLYLKKKPNIILLCISVGLNIAAWMWLGLNIRPALGQVFLHYNILFGVDLVGSWYNVFALPLAGIFIIFCNATLGWRLYKQDPFATYVLQGIAIFVNVLLLISTALLVFLNV